MEITFHGAAGFVTGSCYQLKSEKSNVLVDCGLFQGGKEVRERNYDKFKFNPAEIDAVLLTHAHIDHSGLIPKLVKKGFKGKIYCTYATKDLSEILLPDSAFIQEMEVERKNRKAVRANKEILEPIYTVKDAEESLTQFVGVDYGERVGITEDLHVIYRDAGHILGSSILEVCLGNQKIVFSGDLGRPDQPIIKDPEYIRDADYLVMESTYGNRFHLETEDKLTQIARIVKRTIRKGGNLVIPSFAVERTQELIYAFKILMERGEIPMLDVYIDSPLAIKATKIFSKYPCYYDELAMAMYEDNNNDLFNFKNLKFSLSAEESQRLNYIRKNAIIISASGMADAGRIRHHLKHNLWRKESTVLFVGYQAEGTLGRRILDGEKSVRIHGEEISVKSDIERIDAFSGHADQKGLLDWVKNFDDIKRGIFLVHGEDESSKELKKILEAETDYNILIAKMFQTIELDTLEIKELGVDKLARDTEIDNLIRTFSEKMSTLLDVEKKQVLDDYLEQLKEKLV